MSTAKFDTLSNLAGSLTVPVATVVQGSAKAWVNFNGTGTVAIRAAFNVSSITDNGTGDYTANFATAFADTNYAAVLATRQAATVALVAPAYEVSPSSASALRIYTFSSGGANGDYTYITMAVFR